ncbi:MULTISPECIES: hypothetical protein [unclassified Haladaptatus]|uniref:DUF7860 family protein n=1 Tax=unclassified Haladaptatus TaxID=2622732 RepID=UPI0023E8DB33|nr:MULTISPECIES: hypothetical protein [unclassified Haladaptatus]
MGRYGNIDYAAVTKLGFLLSLGLFAIGAGGELIGHALYSSLPAWEETLFFDLEVIGVLGALLVPLFFGIILPLTE